MWVGQGAEDELSEPWKKDSSQPSSPSPEAAEKEEWSNDWNRNRRT